MGIVSVAVALAFAFAFAASAGPTFAPVPGSTDGHRGEALLGTDPGVTPSIKPGLACGPSKDLTGQEKAWNARFMQWEKVESVIHVLPGRFEGTKTHDVNAHQVLLLGFEWVGSDPADMDASVTNNPDHDLRVVLDGTPVAGDWKAGYQPAYIAQSQCGPAWSWDHDGDGPGDGNGNGVGDFAGAHIFWRAELGPLPSGTYVLDVEFTFDAGATWSSIPGGTIVVR